MHICDVSNDKNIEKLVKANYALDAVGVCIPKNTLRSKEEERSLAILKNTTKYLPEEKRWETGLLWKHDHVELPESRNMATHRLRCLESRMAHDDKLREYVNNQIKLYEERGYVRRVEEHEFNDDKRGRYIPIFVVTNTNKGKSRLVWDAAARVDGVALNSVLLKGPDLLPSLVGVLLRFRKRPTAIAGDIREMFHQVKIRREDQAAQQFLWRCGDSSREPDRYVMQVMTFGASCSPSAANYVKNQNAERFAASQPKAVTAILHSTFVDDWLQSCESEEEMTRLAKSVRAIHADGGFEMRGWTSNSTAVLQALSGSSESFNKCIDIVDKARQRVLGMWCMPRTDEFTFVQKFDDTIFDEKVIPTKSHVLRVVMTIFDPIGLLGFFVIQAKIIIQNVWRSAVGWDERINEDESQLWIIWRRKLRQLEEVRIPRVYALVSQSDNIQLHIFADASINAYAAVAYIRAENNGQVRCSLVASKTRVAPLKPASIPRLELMAAILSLRLAAFIREDLSIPFRRRVFWTDSKNVLYWIRSDARKYHQFVALRIGEILEASEAEEWRHVPSAMNVADDGTKWTKECEFDSNSRWFTGPPFLNLAEYDWPTTLLPKGDIEIERLHLVELSPRKQGTFAAIMPDIRRFSKWEKFRGTLLQVIRFLRLSCKLESTGTCASHMLAACNMATVETIVYSFIQSESYGEDIKRIRDGLQINRKSALYKLSPHLDEDGVLRVRGRIDAIDGVAVNMKRPVILPGRHAITCLIVDYYHRKFHHHPSEVVVNEMRQQYCIVGLRAAVRAAIRLCQRCRNKKAVPQIPEMGNLPPERLAITMPAFSFTGVDYFGPLEVNVGRRREKRWGVLFDGDMQ